MKSFFVQDHSVIGSSQDRKNVYSEKRIPLPQIPAYFIIKGRKKPTRVGVHSERAGSVKTTVRKEEDCVGEKEHTKTNCNHSLLFRNSKPNSNKI